MKISDRSNTKKEIKPFLDTLLALTIDLSMDVIAIRIDAGLWNWKINLSNSITFDSFIGVRYGNFIGWYFIVLIYSSLIRYGREKYRDKQTAYSGYLFVIPFFGLIPFYILFESIQQGKRIFNFDPYFMLVVIFLIAIAVYQIWTNLQVQQPKIPQYSTNSLIEIELIAFYSFHIFFLIALFIQKIYISAPLIIIPSIMAILIHYISHNLILVDNKSTKKIQIHKYIRS